MKTKIEVSFHMKSGKTIKVYCEDVKIKHINNELTGYEIVGIDQSKSGNPLYLRLEQIEAITVGDK